MGEIDGAKKVKNATVQKALSLLMIAIGIALLAFMITVEGELGAVPLLTLIGGIAWHAWVLFRQNSM